MNTASDVLTHLEEQRAEVVAMARDFATREIVPHAAEWDREARFPVETMKRLADLGFFGMLIPEEYDGLGLDLLTYLMVLEEIAVADAGVAVSLSIHNSLAAGMILAQGSDEQRSRWLKPMARGDVLAAFSLSEPDSGSDAASLSTRAERSGTQWVLNGMKAWVTNGDVADLIIVMARSGVSDTPPGARGISAFLLPRRTPGVTPGKPEDKMGLRASHTTTLALTDVRLGAEALLGKEGVGFAYALAGLDRGRLGIAAQAVGISRAALDHAVRYVSERKQFDTPIREFQAIQFRLADMATRVAAARSLLHEAARGGVPNAPANAQASMAKLFASETAMWVTTHAVQIFGGYGYMRDYPVERLFRDAKVTEIYEGTSEIQRMVIGRALGNG
ncbi:MAG: acyl-CoA dehydrogenase [Gemmatimonadetes bacterium]|nr:acyl-CoA dehydrogenase [Gemmatimonadota bacterium]